MTNGFAGALHPRNAAGRFMPKPGSKIKPISGGHTTRTFKAMGGVGQIRRGSTVNFVAVRTARGSTIRAQRIGAYRRPLVSPVVRPGKMKVYQPPPSKVYAKRAASASAKWGRTSAAASKHLAHSQTSGSITQFQITKLHARRLQRSYGRLERANAHNYLHAVMQHNATQHKQAALNRRFG